MTLLADRPVVAPAPSPSAIVGDAASVQTPAVTPARPRWPWVAAGVAFVQYTIIGAWLLYERHYAIGDSLSRTLSAKLMVLSRDPHLGAVGFYWMPMPTIARIPFVLLLQPLGRPELAGPLTSALFAALTIPVLASVARLLRVPRAGAVVAAIYALSPVTMYIGANGMSESMFAFCIALTMWAYLRWRHQGTIQSLALLGLALGVTVACRYEGLVLMPVVALAVALGNERAQRAHAVLLSIIPAAAVFLAWSLASSLILDDGLFWYNASRTTTGTPVDAAWLPSDRSFGSVVGYLAVIVGALAPALLAVAAGCVSAFRRWRTSIGIVAFIAGIPSVVAIQLVGGSSWGVPRFFVTIPVVAAIGVLWVVRAARGDRRTAAFGVAGVVLLAVGSVTGGLVLSSHRYAYAEGEYAFFGPLFGREPAGQTVPADGPNRVFSGDIRPYERVTVDLDRLLATGQRAAMDSLQAVPVLLSDHPKQWIVPEDRDFEEILSDPVGRFDFIVILPSTSPTVYRVLLENELQRNTGGEWAEVGDYDGVVLVYEWVPTGHRSTFVQGDRLQTPAPDL